MHSYIKNNKTANIYWLKGPLSDVKFTITIKSHRSIKLLPTFNDISHDNEEGNLSSLADKPPQTYMFRWQEKLFNDSEFQKFKNKHNCVSERDFEYHNLIVNSNKQAKKVFTYLHGDFILPHPIINEVKHDSGVFNVSSCLKCLKLDKISRLAITETKSIQNLMKSEEELISNENQWISMHVFYDNSNYDEDSNLIYKDECLLLSLYYHSGYNYLMVSPDINNEANPYSIESASGYLDLEYFISIDFGSLECGEELIDLLKKLHYKWEKKEKYLYNFIMPPFGKTSLYVTLEISTLENFDLDNIYIKFHIELPDDVDCKSDLNGRTHVSESLATDDSRQWMYGHFIDIQIDVATGIKLQPLKVYFEVISIDNWGRHRTEGYSYLPLALEPGFFSDILSCSRPEELNKIDAENRRFFIGGYHLLDDLKVLEKPQLYDVNYRYVSTGKISVNWTIMCHSHSPLHSSSVPHTSGAAVLQGADAVLKKYKRAKATLAAATRCFKKVPDN